MNLKKWYYKYTKIYENIRYYFNIRKYTYKIEFSKIHVYIYDIQNDCLEYSPNIVYLTSEKRICTYTLNRSNLILIDLIIIVCMLTTCTICYFRNKLCLLYFLFLEKSSLRVPYLHLGGSLVRKPSWVAWKSTISSKASCEAYIEQLSSVSRRHWIDPRLPPNGWTLSS